MCWLREQGVEVDERTKLNAARFGHLQLCQHLRAEGAPGTIIVLLQRAEMVRRQLCSGC
jgi:hypothetical protein